VAAFYPLARFFSYRVGSFYWSGFIIAFMRPPTRSEIKEVIYWVSEILFATQIAFRSLHRGMPQ
jgi:hypothetical protein